MKKILCGVLVATLISCGSKRHLPGTWTVSGADDPPGSVTTMTFAEPDKLSMTFDMPISAAGLTAQVHADATGTYVMDGDSLALHFVDAKMTAKGLNPAQTAAFEAGVQQQKTKFLEGLNANSKGRVVWKDNDHFVGSGSKAADKNFVRIKR